MKKKLLLISAFLLPVSFINGWGSSANAQGNFDWAKQIGSINYDQVLSIKTDGSGNVYTMGAFVGIADLDPGAGVFNVTANGGLDDQDIFITKFDASGNFVWGKRLGGLNGDQPAYMTADGPGNVYILGTFQGNLDLDPGAGSFPVTTLSDNSDVFIVKLDASGNFVWGKQFTEILPHHNSQGVGLAVDAAGDVYSSGAFTGTTDFNPGAGVDTLTPSAGMIDGNQDLFICKLDATGDFVWVKQFNGASDIQDGVLLTKSGNLAADPSGNVYNVGGFKGVTDFDPNAGEFTLTGTGGTHSSDKDMYVVRLNADGSFGWAEEITSELSVVGNGIAADASGNVFVTGNYQGTTDFNPGVGTYNQTAIGDNDVFIFKLDTAGNFGWAKVVGGEASDFGSDITVDTAGFVYTTGTFSDSIDFNPGAGTFYMASSSLFGTDAFVIKLDEAGSFVWSKHIGGTAESIYDEGVSVAVYGTRSTYFAGVFRDMIDMDPGPASFNFNSIGGPDNNDVFVEKLQDTVSTIGIAEHTGHGITNLYLYPNPGKGIFQLVMNLEADSKLTIDIVDVTGQVVKTIPAQLFAGVNAMTVDATELPNGMYFVNMYNGHLNKTLKLVINK